MSKNPLAWKFILIAVVIGVAFLFTFPPKDRINLGLDLKGGAHYLMQVQTDTAIKFEMDRVQNSLGQRFKTDGIGYQAILPAGEATLEIRGTSPDQRAEIRTTLEQFVGGWDAGEPGRGHLANSHARGLPLAGRARGRRHDPGHDPQAHRQPRCQRPDHPEIGHRRAAHPGPAAGRRRPRPGQGPAEEPGDAGVERGHLSARGGSVELGPAGRRRTP